MVTFACLLALAPCAASAVDGAPDPAFNGNGRAVIDVGDDTRLTAVAESPDGKLVVVGEAKLPLPDDPSNTAWVIARWNSDGTRDTTFGPAHTGVVILDLNVGPAYMRFDGATAVAVQPDGKVVVGGYARATPNDAYLAVARFTVAGNLDPTFADGQGKATFPQIGSSFSCALRLRKGGEILVTPKLISGDNVLVQLTSTGFLDPMFGLGGVTLPWSCGSFACGWFIDALELPDGKLLALGIPSSRDRLFLVRFFGTLYHTGEVDDSFGDHGVASFTPAGFSGLDVLGFALDPSARVTVLVDDTNRPERTALLRVHEDQSDASFGSGGWDLFSFQPPTSTTAGTPMALLLQADGKALIAGTGLVNGTWNFVVTRRTADGKAVDTTFSGGWSTIAYDIGGGLTDFPTAMGSRSGRPVVAGLAQSSSTWLYAAARLDNSLIWTDGFESGSTFFWPSPP